jgi:hypothetical protein
VDPQNLCRVKDSCVEWACSASNSESEAQVQDCQKFILIRHSACPFGAATHQDRDCPLTLIEEERRDAFVLSLDFLALRTTWLIKQNCNAHRRRDFKATAIPELTTVLFTRSHNQPG